MARPIFLIACPKFLMACQIFLMACPIFLMARYWSTQPGHPIFDRLNHPC
jgi:hypothetical protein